MDARTWFYFGHTDPMLLTSINGLADIFDTFAPWLEAAEGDYMLSRAAAAGDHHACARMHVTVKRSPVSCGPCRSSKQEANLLRTQQRLQVLINRTAAIAREGAEHV